LPPNISFAALHASTESVLYRLHSTFQQLIAACGNRRTRARHRNRRLNADAVMRRTIVLEHFHTCPTNCVPARQLNRIDVAFGARRGPADNLTEFVVLDNAHTGFGIADRAPIRDESPLGFEEWRLRLNIPFATA